MSNEKKTIVSLIQNKQDKGKKRIAAYCRVSTGKDEQLHSLAAQINYYKRILSEDETCQFAGIYADEGTSGTQVKHREQFLNLIEDCRSGLVEGIVTKSVSRFGRNTVDTLLYTRELRSLGIDIYFEKENLHSCSPDGELMLTLMAAFAESESESMSENIKWGKRRLYEKGKVESLALANLYGYCKKDGQLAINETEAPFVSKMFQEYLDGLNFQQIADKMNTDGIPTRRHDAKWYNKTVMGILTNEKYMGDCLFQKTFHIDAISHKSVLNRGELPQFYVESCIPVIVEKELWELVQLEIKRRQSMKPISSEERPFKGRIVCGTCGKPVTQYSSKYEKQITQTVYRCISWEKQQGTVIPDMMYLMPHKSTYTKNPSQYLIEYREKYCTKLEERPMLCSDTRLPLDRPAQAFVTAWNLIVSKRLRYQATLKRTAETSEDPLMRYRATEMIRMIDEFGKIPIFDYWFSLKVLDRMELMPTGKLAVLFLSGLRITL